MLDKNGKLFGKISIIDIAVICIILISIAGAYLTFLKIKADKPVDNTTKIEKTATEPLDVTFRLESVRQMTVDALHVGDDVFVTDLNQYLGQITSIETEPATLLIFDQEGNAVEAETPERSDVVLVVRIDGKVFENAYYTDKNVQLLYDSAFGINTPTISTIPNIKEITRVAGK